MAFFNFFNFKIKFLDHSDKNGINHISDQTKNKNIPTIMLVLTELNTIDSVKVIYLMDYEHPYIEQTTYHLGSTEV